MHIQWSVILSLGLASACGSPPAAPPAAPTARVDLGAARSTALARIPGKVLKEELEHENGRDIYSFDIRPDAAGTALKEVHIDANDGSIVAVEDEEPDEADRED